MHTGEALHIVQLSKVEVKRDRDLLGLAHGAVRDA